LPFFWKFDDEQSAERGIEGRFFHEMISSANSRSRTGVVKKETLQRDLKQKGERENKYGASEHPQIVLLIMIFDCLER
jgi:hypothetical protein